MKNFIKVMGALSRGMLFLHGHATSPRALADPARSAPDGDGKASQQNQQRGHNVCKAPQAKHTAGPAGWNVVGLR
jgi:hypothetical protein